MHELIINPKTGKIRPRDTWQIIKNQKQLMLMSLPLLIHVLLFSYIPVWGWLMAFQDYKPNKSIIDQTWVGFKHFEFLFRDIGFWNIMRNTLGMSIINLTLGFFSAITLALLLNEVKVLAFKRLVQTISYLPHFLSWIIVTGIIFSALSTEGGIVNIVLMKLGLIKAPILWLSEPKYFWGIVGISHVWKEVGWNTIIYLAAISAIDPGLYESASIDGCNRYQKMWHITLPGIRSTFMILLIMNIGWILNSGFEIQYFLGNGLVVDWSDNIDIFVLKYGINKFNYSFATAAGIFKSVISISMLFIANSIAKKFGEDRLI